ncbi:helix-turn-helix transcriptional regulator [Lysobacter arenosi]|uniref:Helix-turn-helix transcriptional regulator n=1 Tax=Lysobacter arenosi TaxID=2795387 RepID=A0ABX7RHM9_9GAMM|nr:AraC family transcriptional regulator [Lysobacter arenosi]QSX76467.1 helix-turn-helix transcriptional regulator [Lysobacter arenosi]
MASSRLSMQVLSMQATLPVDALASRYAEPATGMRPVPAAATMPLSPHRVWAHDGQFREISAAVPVAGADAPARVCWAAVSRLGSIALTRPSFSLWMQIRGSAQVHAAEGTFRLRTGAWIALDADSAPEVQADQNGLTLALVVPADLMPLLQDAYLFVGKGTMTLRDRILALRLWHGAVRVLQAHERVPDRTLVRALRPLILHMSAVQARHVAALGHCPGHSRTRKRRLFNRLQRARLYLEGNAHRMVRMSEIMAISNYSLWYLSKSFHELYGESVQTAASRLRIERAYDLLETTSMDITEIAESCGFDNACSFARAFRAKSGTNATQFRSALRDAGGGRRRPVISS